MSDNRSRKRNEPLLFEVQLNLLPDQRGILTAKDVKGVIHISTPPEFGGPENNWSPEHLFLCSISSCFMTTYQFFAKGFEIRDLQCDCIGQVQLLEGKYHFTRIDLYPKIYVSQKEILEKAEQAILKTQEHCLVAHAVKCQLIYHSQVLLMEATSMNEQQTM